MALQSLSLLELNKACNTILRPGGKREYSTAGIIPSTMLKGRKKKKKKKKKKTKEMVDNAS